MFCEYHSISTNLLYIYKKLEKAIFALRCALLPDGRVPMIGDSSLYQLRYHPIDGTHVFKKAGYLFHKNKETYFSYKCGFSSKAHKHGDDNSIILRHNRKDIFVDCGKYNYDDTDSIRMFVAGPQGHSSIYPTAMDQIYGANYEEFIIKTSFGEYRHYNDGFSVTGSITLSNGLIITRQIMYNGNTITIKDSWKNNHEHFDLRQRFCCHPDAIVSKTEKSDSTLVNILIGDVYAYMTISNSPQQYGSVYLEKGYYSEQYYEYQRNPIIDIMTGSTSSGCIEVKISYGSKADDACEGSISTSHDTALSSSAETTETVIGRD
jgi:hypothetical protein